MIRDIPVAGMQVLFMHKQLLILVRKLILLLELEELKKTKKDMHLIQGFGQLIKSEAIATQVIRLSLLIN